MLLCICLFFRSLLAQRSLCAFSTFEFSVYKKSSTTYQSFVYYFRIYTLSLIPSKFKQNYWRVGALSPRMRSVFNEFSRQSLLSCPSTVILFCVEFLTNKFVFASSNPTRLSLFCSCQYLITLSVSYSITCTVVLFVFSGTSETLKSLRHRYEKSKNNCAFSYQFE